MSWEDKLIVKWKEKSIYLWKNTEILDTELLAILEALVIARKMANSLTPVTILSNSPKELRAIALFFTSPENRFF